MIILRIDDLGEFFSQFDKMIKNFNSIPDYRLEELDYDVKPKDENECNVIINEAPLHILKGLGFKKWLDFKKANEISPYKIEEVEDKDNFDIWLFPVEWEDVIPKDFKCINPRGEDVIYEKNCEPILGVLPYGIKKPHNVDEENKLYIEFKEILLNGFK